MIKDTTIQAVRAAMDTRETLEHFNVKFKNNVAICPYHDEKSGSFHVKKSTNLYKCFGCGESGDAITATMKLGKMTFTEAIEHLAGRYNITIEYDQQSAQETEEKKQARLEQFKILEWAQAKYEACLHTMPQDNHVWEYLNSRGLTSEVCREWSIGFAPNDWKFITEPLISSGRYQPGLDAGLIVTKEGKNFDFFHNRIMFPIYNTQGLMAGFGGRVLDDSKPKYKNSSESLTYSKMNIWFGLNHAEKAIKEEGFAYVVEGYTDVISWHQAGVHNTVAGCGTEINETQIRVLKRYTSRVVITLDGDAAGTKKALKLVDLFLQQDFTVEVIEIPEGKDPDEYKRNYFLTQTIQTNEEAAVEGN